MSDRCWWCLGTGDDVKSRWVPIVRGSRKLHDRCAVTVGARKDTPAPPPAPTPQPEPTAPPPAPDPEAKPPEAT